MKEIVLDTETTGLDPRSGHRIIEIGAIELRDKVPTQNIFHTYINPERNVPSEAYHIHGISSDFLKDKPKFSDIADQFLSFIDGAKLVIHNAAFDMKFLNHELILLNKKAIDFGVVIDTLMIARKKFPGSRVNLNALCKKFKINNDHRQLHGALLDSELLAEVYVCLTGGRQYYLAMKNKELEPNLSNVSSICYSKKIVIPTKKEEELHSKMLKQIQSPLWGLSKNRGNS